MMKRNSGFTLIELLVVIAIIAMLAAILVPAVNKALDSAAMVQTVSNGGNIYKSAFSGIMDDSMFGSASWPSTSDDYAKTSTDYFIYLVTNGTMHVSFDFFSAKGVTPYKGQDSSQFKAVNNAWRLVRGLDACSEGFPFLLTKNAKDLSASTINSDSGDITLDKGTAPFGEKGMVAVLKGGSAFSLKGANQLKITNLNPAGKQDNVTIDVVDP